MKQLYITLLLALVGTAGFAQKDFRPGYLVQNGDTLTGLVDYRGAKQSSNVVIFKANQNASEQAFGPEHVQGFGFDKEQKLFQSKLIPAFDSLNTPQTLFAEVLVKGQANLYFLRDPMQQDRFYISKGSAALQELRVEDFKQKNMKQGHKYGNTMLMRRELYKPVLFHNFMDCNTIKEADIDKVVLGYNSLTAIVKKYNQCVGQEEYSKPQQKIKVGIGAVAGVSSSSLSFTVDGEEHLFKDNSVKPIAGFFFHFSKPTFSEKISLQAEMLFTSLYYEGNTGDNPTIPGTTTTENWLDVKHLKIPVMLRYSYPRGTLRPYLHFGPVVNVIIAKDSETKTTTSLGGTSRTSSKKLLEDDDYRNFALGLIGGAGLSYPVFGKPLSLEARYERNNGISHFNMHSTRITSYSLLLSYKL
ncbi:PorT family protein [Pontibacter sp. Tf4]|uniref:porin family protein n=1 Tax=Pontibacter sp. Tf4 TaxID=2761620 RepID=UPI001627220A|nr:porin family protein [Pontibacter sp. Tf4]MBB6612221.1 PorT family protein [Pontibacter sp. Tf4]